MLRNEKISERKPSNSPRPCAALCIPGSAADCKMGIGQVTATWQPQFDYVASKLNVVLESTLLWRG